MKILFPTPCPQFTPCLSRVSGKAFVLSTLVALLFSVPVFADETADVNKLLRAGQFAEALGKTDAFLAKNPHDKQMRFLKGVILSEQNKAQEAITVFTKLTEDFPDLPEPYNNLAVLFASTGQYDKARAALDMAIRTNPTYATAHENLGDIYAKLASQAYDKALQLDSGNSATKSKLTLVRTLVGNTTGGTNPKVVATTAPSAPVNVSKPVPPPLPIPAVAVAPPVSLPIPKQETAKPEVRQPPKAAPASIAETSGEHNDVLNVVNNWAKAWSAKDMKDYLNHYTSDFAPANGGSHKSWAEERRNRIEGKGRINVKIDAPQVTVNGNTATIKFRQIYTSDRLTANSRKTLIMTKQGGKWRITQERTGN